MEDDGGRGRSPRREALRASIPCRVCGREATRIELIPLEDVPDLFERRDRRGRRSDDPTDWVFRYNGLAAGNGSGDRVADRELPTYREALREPVTYERVHALGLFDNAGFCASCDAAYCYAHWHPSPTEYGTCPHGHGKSLDPHWSPEDID